MICPVILMVLLALHRIGEVFTVKTVAPKALDVHLLINSWNSALFDQQQVASRQQTTVRDGLLSLSVNSSPHRPRNDDEWNADAQKNLQLLASDLSTLNQPVTTGDFAFALVSLRNLDLILSRAAAGVQAEKFDKALEYRLASLKLARLFATRNDSRAWSVASSVQGLTIQALLQSFNDAPQRSTDLAHAVDQISAELQRFPSLANASVVDYLENYNEFVATNDRRFISAVWEYRGLQNNSVYQAAQYARLPWERLRYARLLVLEGQINYQECLALDRPEHWARMFIDYNAHGSDQRPTDFDDLRRTVEPLIETTFQPDPFLRDYHILYENRVKQVLEPMKELMAVVQGKLAEELVP